MQLGVTIPLQRFLRLPRPPYGEADDPLFCWEAHRVLLGGCDVLLAVNASNRFLAAACMQPGDWAGWEGVAVASMRAALAQAGVGGPAADAYLFFAGAPEVTRTHGRRPVAFLNVLADQLLSGPARVDPESSFQPDLCCFANDELPGRAAGFEGLGLASERFAADLRRLGIGEPT